MKDAIRTVQLVGNSTLAISLPKEWAKRNNIDKGSKIYIEFEHDGSLRLIPVQRVKSREKISVYEERNNVDSSVLAKKLISAYIAGYDVLRISVPEIDGKEVIDRIKKVLLSKTLDLIVIDEGPGRIELRVLESKYEVSMNESVGWMTRHLVYMLEDLIRGLEEKEIKYLESSIERDDLIDQVYLVLTRYLTGILTNRYSPQTAKVEIIAEVIHYYHGFKVIERIADHVANIATHIAHYMKMGGQLPEELMKLIKNTTEIVRETMFSFFRLDEELSTVLISKIESFSKNLPLVYEKGVFDNLYMYSVVTSLSRIMSYCMDIVEIVFDIKMLRQYSSSL